jgi:hypothetical protein
MQKNREKDCPGNNHLTTRNLKAANNNTEKQQAEVHNEGMNFHLCMFSIFLFYVPHKYIFFTSFTLNFD